MFKGRKGGQAHLDPSEKLFPTATTLQCSPTHILAKDPFLKSVRRPELQSCDWLLRGACSCDVGGNRGKRWRR